MRLLLATLVFISIAIPANAAKFKCGQTPIRPNVMVKPKPKKERVFERRIMGGIFTVPNSWPWQVWLRQTNKTHTSSCGGTIIARQWILTAAHCFRNQKSEEVRAYVGLQNLKARGQPLHVQKMYVHPKYTRRIAQNDIKLIKLKQPIVYNDHVQPICLPSADDDAIAPPNTAWATGWGATENSRESQKLLEVNLPFVDFDECNAVYKKILNGTLQVCAGKEGKGGCNGDSGGPLVAQSSDGSWFQHGVTSVGQGCGSDVPGIFTRVSGYCRWIKWTTKGAAVCHEL